MRVCRQCVKSESTYKVCPVTREAVLRAAGVWPTLAGVVHYKDTDLEHLQNGLVSDT